MKEEVVTEETLLYAAKEVKPIAPEIARRLKKLGWGVFADTVIAKDGDDNNSAAIVRDIDPSVIAEMKGEGDG
jgi:hypothetical protein